MLVIRRKLGDRVVIDGGRIVVELIDADDGWAKLGFTAAREVQIDREERIADRPRACALCGEATCWRVRGSHPDQITEDRHGQLRYDDSLDHPGVAPCGPVAPAKK